MYFRLNLKLHVKNLSLLTGRVYGGYMVYNKFNLILRANKVFHPFSKAQ